MLYLKFVASTVPDVWRAFQNSKSKSHDPLTTTFDPILHFLLVPIVFHMRAKFDVSGFNCFRDMEVSI